MLLLPALAVTLAFNTDFAFAIENGGLGDVPSLDATNTPSAVPSISSTNTYTVLNSETKSDTKSQTTPLAWTPSRLFNQWGFTGSQSRWIPDTTPVILSALSDLPSSPLSDLPSSPLSDLSRLSLSQRSSSSMSQRSSSSMSRLKNSTLSSAGATPMMFNGRDVSWYNVVVVGAVALTTFGLHCL